MKTSARPLVHFSLLAFIILLSFDATAQTVRSGGSTIRGRAIYDDTEHPVRRAQVVLYSEQGPYRSRSTFTDASGEFVVKNVPAGDWVIIVAYPGRMGEISPEQEERSSVDVSVDGSANKDVKVRVVRGAAITGKITYPDGEPVVNAQVNLFVKREKRWVPATMSSEFSTSDDRGVYRIYSLPAGEYVVSVTERSFNIEERDGETIEIRGNKSLNPYFYQDAPNFRTAQVLKLEEGQELNNINVTLADRSTHKLGGTVTLRGKPLPDVYVRLETRDENNSGPDLGSLGVESARSDENGRWIFRDVPDGNYEIVVDNMSSTTSFSTSTIEGFVETKMGDVVEKKPAFVNQRRQVTVLGGDLLDVAIALSEGGRISGKIIVEGDKPLPNWLMITAELPKSKGETASVVVERRSNGLFVLEGVVAGENIFKVPHLGHDYYVRSMTWKGRDLFNQPITVEDRKETSGVTVVLSMEMGTLTGQILDSSNKKPLAARQFVLVPVDESKPTQVGMIPGSSDIEGRFTVSGPPGEYLFITIPDKPNWPESPSDIKKLDPQAQHVTLRLNNQTPVEILARVNP